MKKTCSKCKEEKDLSEFRKDRSKACGYQSFCKVCARAHHRSNYSEKYSEKYNVRNKERRARNAAILQEYKRSLKCSICGEFEPCCLEFHHTDPSSKEFTIAAEMGRNWVSIEKEITKCVCLCSNCHKKVHAGVIELDS